MSNADLLKAKHTTDWPGKGDTFSNAHRYCVCRRFVKSWNITELFLFPFVSDIYYKFYLNDTTFKTDKRTFC